jgi:hypothetical protein
MAVAQGKLFLGQDFSDNRLVVDLSTKNIVTRIQIPGGGEGSIVATPDGVLRQQQGQRPFLH